MSQVELSEIFLAEIGGWETVKEARSLLRGGQALSANWSPPILKGVVREGSTSYRAGLVIRNRKDIDNLCSCRRSQRWGIICAHSVAIGLLEIRRSSEEPAPDSAAPACSAPRADTSAAPHSNSRSAPTKPAASGLRRLPQEQGGRPLELNVILPPNLERALTQGKVMLNLEGAWRNGRTPLNHLPKDQAFAVDEPDEQLLQRLEVWTRGEPPGSILLSRDELVELLPALAEHPRVTLGKSQPVTITRTPWMPPLQATLEESGEIRIELRGSPRPTLLQPQNREESIWVFSDHCFQPLALDARWAPILEGPVRLSRSQVPDFLNREWPTWCQSDQVIANFQLEDFTLQPRSPSFLLHLTGGLARLQAHLQCAYGESRFTVGTTPNDSSFWLPDPESPTTYATRDLPAEQTAVNRLLQAGFQGPNTDGRYELEGQQPVLTFFAREYPGLCREWSVTLEERLEWSTDKKLERIEPQFQVTSSGERWFDFEVRFQSSSGEVFSQAEIQRLLLSGRSSTRLKNGKTAVIDTAMVEEFQEILQDCDPKQHNSGYRLHNAQAGFLDAALRERAGWEIKAPETWLQHVARQQGKAVRPPPALGDLEDVLRSYQKSGVGWFWFLRENRFGGILADEMGLGKTLQTLAFLKTVRESQNPEDRLPFLVVCPTSLVHNWAAETQKFTPNLRSLAVHGPNRSRLFKQIPEADLVITSYALIRRDAKRYRDFTFDTIVLDEAQHIKNRQSQNARAVKGMAGTHRLVLTGTPLENSVLDLWSLFDFLMPGYLGRAEDFRERYELPITSHKDAQALERLSRRVRPFILRRTKHEVAQDLPEKINQVAYCELTPQQSTLYKEVLETGRDEVFRMVNRHGLGKSRVVVLNTLLRLRQICCDLRLLQLPNSKAARSSGKLELFGELLEEVLDGGHRVLVFSQFVEMLKLLRQHLESQEIRYAYLDGSTTQRAEVIDEFRTDPGIQVFLISLKAGGLGLNLSEADTVIHFDPWWNPSVEEQATDRAHRIGQTQVVTSYKLITRQTVEEKILSLQRRKREVFQETLGEESKLVDNLSWEEIQELLAD